MKLPNLNILKLSAALTAALMLTACGGGGGNSFSAPVVISPPPPPPPPSGPTFTPGVFAAESSFQDQCARPRSGINPATGNPYRDRAGSTTLENFWLRSWSNRTYLWYNEITDRNPYDFNNTLDYFDLLKTTAVTASGTPKDQFHFTIPTDEYQESVSSGASSGYGATFTIINATVPREIRVAYTENTGPAAVNLSRGTEILEINGVDVVNDGTQAGVDVINAGLFPNNDGETYNFTVRDAGSNSTRAFSMTSATITEEPVLLTKTVDVNGTNVGYILFNTFGTSIAEEDLFDAFTAFETAGIDELVVDLRYNGGGFLDISSQLGYMVAGSVATSGRTFDELTFNDKFPTTNPVTGQTLSPTPFHSTGQDFSVSSSTALPSLDLPRVFVLSTARTCSASEAFINALRGIFLDVVLIGSRTCGKPYGFYATDNCGTTYFTIQFRGENDQGFGDYADGFSPATNGDGIGEAVTGCTVADDFLDPLGDESERLFETALAYIDTGACPAPPVAALPSPALQQSAASAQIIRDPDTAIMQSDRLKRREFLRQSRLLRAPQNGETR